jgi:ribonucleoside-diphosphate reductase alpha chain
MHYPFWHLEVEDLLVLKNNKGTEDNRIRHLDYSVQFNKVMYERLLSGGNITLFSPHDCPDLYEAFFRDIDEFRTLYEKYEKSKIRKRSVPAIDLFSSFITERKDTGRIYFQNVDHCNDHGSFDKRKALIKMSNLCQEITLPTTPLKDINDETGEISLCTLAAINWGKIKKPSDFEKPCTLAVRALDSLLDYQDYPVRAAELGTMARRPLGVGIINFAYWLAKNGSTYSSPNLDLVHEYAEAWSYYLIKASVDLAEEVNPCPKHADTLYSAGVLPIDTYKKEVDELVAPVYKMDWNALAFRAAEFGIRNSTLMALMPAETSAQISNSTNGIEPPRALVSIKQSKDGVLKQVVPGINNRNVKYELLWDQPSPEGYLKIMAVLQKFIDQSISTNTSYNPKFYEDGKISMSVMLQHLLMMYKYGIKTGYYFNTNDGAGEIELEDLAQGELDEEDCESCKI